MAEHPNIGGRGERRMRIVVAPDSFKGSVDAADAARCIADGWCDIRPDDEVRLRPMADGGEGTMAAIAAATPGAVFREVRVTGPDERSVDAAWLLLPDGSAVVELAASSGLTLLAAPAPLEAHTVGFGQVIAAALAAGAQRVFLALGGSASTDGGMGALEALGMRFLDASDHPVGHGGGALHRVARVDRSAVLPVPAGGAVILRDVASPLLGPTGAARMFGPQKGVTPAQIAELESGLAHLADLLEQDPAVPGAGAAGGTGLGMLAWGAVSRSGAGTVADLLDLPATIAASDLVITGEGRFDDQSSQGKVAGHIAAIAGAAHVPALLVAGSIAAPPTAFESSVALVDLAGSTVDALRDARLWLRHAGRRLAAERSADRS